MYAHERKFYIEFLTQHCDLFKLVYDLTKSSSVVNLIMSNISIKRIDNLTI